MLSAVNMSIHGAFPRRALSSPTIVPPIPTELIGLLVERALDKDELTQVTCWLLGADIEVACS